MSEISWSITVPVTLQCIQWARHSGHGTDPLSIALRQVFGITKHKILFSLGGQYFSHKKLSVAIHDCDSPLILFSYELSEGCQEILWDWIHSKKITPFKTTVTFTQEQKDIIVEVQRRNRLGHKGIDLMKPTTEP
jgi:hypothetical protein